MDVCMREATWEDAGKMALYRYQMFAEMMPEKDISEIKTDMMLGTEAFYKAHEADPDLYSVVAVVENQVVGSGSIQFQERPPSVRTMNNIHGYIFTIYVEAGYRRRGIARSIMEALHQKAKERGAGLLALNASDEGKPLYTQMGYDINPTHLEMRLYQKKNTEKGLK